MQAKEPTLHLTQEQFDRHIADHTVPLFSSPNKPGLLYAWGIYWRVVSPPSLNARQWAPNSPIRITKVGDTYTLHNIQSQETADIVPESWDELVKHG